MKVGLEESKKRLKEVAGFEEAHRTACIKNQQISVERVREFETLKKEVSFFIALDAHHTLFSDMSY